MGTDSSVGYNVQRWSRADVETSNPMLRKVSAIVNKHLEHCPDHPGLRLLDVGCGNGKFAAQYLKRGIEVWGVDITPKLVTAAKKRGIRVVRHDLNKKLPLKDNFFDIITCSEVIEHVFNTEQLLRELKRVLRPGGIVVLTTPNLVGLENRLRILFGRHPSFFEYSERDAMGHIRAYSSRELLKQAKLVGFKNIKLTGSTFPFPHEKLGIVGKLLVPALVKLADVAPHLSAHSVLVASK